MVTPGPGSIKSSLLFWQKAGQVYQGRAGSHGLLLTFQVAQFGSRGRCVDQYRSGRSVQPAVCTSRLPSLGPRRPLPPLAADPSLLMQEGQGTSTRQEPVTCFTTHRRKGKKMMRPAAISADLLPHTSYRLLK